jgi:hypothetical protein
MCLLWGGGCGEGGMQGVGEGGHWIEMGIVGSIYQAVHMHFLF